VLSSHLFTLNNILISCLQRQTDAIPTRPRPWSMRVMWTTLQTCTPVFRGTRSMIVHGVRSIPSKQILRVVVCSFRIIKCTMYVYVCLFWLMNIVLFMSLWYRGRVRCSIFHCHWRTASINPRLLLFLCKPCFLSFLYRFIVNCNGTYYALCVKIKKILVSWRIE